MLLRNRVGEPLDKDIAIRNPSATPDKYRLAIADASQHWQREHSRAHNESNDPLLSMTQALLDFLVDPFRTWQAVSRKPYCPRKPTILEQARLTALSALSISVFLRHEWGDKTPIEPAFLSPDGKPGSMLDMIVDIANWQDFRIHTPIVAQSALPSNVAEQWYKEGNLWVRHVRPADPTAYLKDTFLPERGIEPDFSNHIRFVPINSHPQLRQPQGWPA